MQSSLRSLSRSSRLLHAVSRNTLSASRAIGATRQAHFLNASTKEFDERVRNGGDKPVLVDFYANWCGPCKMLSPLLESITEDGAEVPAGSQAVDLVTVNTDEEAALAREFGISSLPTVIAFKNGKQIKNFVGARPPQFIQAFIKDL